MEPSQSMRSEIYLLLATLFRKSPDSELLAFLKELEFENNGTPMAQAWSSLKESANNADFSETEDEYQELFIGIGRGEVVPFSSWHLTGSLMEKPLANIRLDLARLGLERIENVKEPEDHISALCETMAYLCDQEDESKQQSFFNRHLSTWFEKLATQINQAEHTHFYRAVTELFNAFMALESVRFAESKATKRNTHKIEVKNLTDRAAPSL